MPETRPNPDTGDEHNVDAAPGGATGPPRWVKGFAVGLAVLVLLFLALQLAGIGDHGPRRHLFSGEAATALFAVLPTALERDGVPLLAAQG